MKVVSCQKNEEAGVDVFIEMTSWDRPEIIDVWVDGDFAEIGSSVASRYLSENDREKVRDMAIDAAMKFDE